MTETSTKLGRFGENAAAQYLRDSGYTVIDRNFRTYGGEIDIIAKCENIISFVEVKLRNSSDTAKFGRASRAVNSVKRQHIIYAANVYINEKHLSDQKISLDVMEIYYTQTCGGNIVLRINHIKGAFGAPYIVERGGGKSRYN